MLTGLESEALQGMPDIFSGPMVRPLTVGDVVRRILPAGSTAEKNLDWSSCPWWPGDVFAVAATLVQISSCYADPGIALSRNQRERRKKADRARAAIRIGKVWASTPRIPNAVVQAWTAIFSAFRSPVCDPRSRARLWKSAALSLVAICDECLAGAGYFPQRKNEISGFIWDELELASNHPPIPDYLRLPESLTNRVPPEVVCVVPKARTPEVGCTLRSLTHHVALIPGKGIVKTEWYVGQGGRAYSLAKGQQSKSQKRSRKSDENLNLLLVPFPYVVHVTDFKVSREPTKSADGYFSISQGWLFDRGRPIRPQTFVSFLEALINTAERDGEPMHGLVFPEGALTEQLLNDVVPALAKRHRSLEMVISGLMTGKKPAKRNMAAHFRIANGQIIGSFSQSKHHRWKLDASQITRYGLGAKLNPKKKWWEHIDVHDRSLQFGINRHEAVIAALVCEDLARYDPVLPAVTAVGPSLVVALLLDGPQLKFRWPGRYATVLADDPGSSVLTLTSLGMIRRAGDIGGSGAAIGLWKDKAGDSTELILPVGNHGLVLSLNRCEVQQVTLDGREDGNSTTEYRLRSVQPVRLRDAPAWLERMRHSA